MMDLSALKSQHIGEEGTVLPLSRKQQEWMCAGVGGGSVRIQFAITPCPLVHHSLPSCTSLQATLQYIRLSLTGEYGSLAHRGIRVSRSPGNTGLSLTGEYGRRQTLLDQLDVLGSKGAQQEVERGLLEEPHR